MKITKNLLVIIILFIPFISIYGGISKFDEKIDVGNGLFKVKTNNRWGLIDKDGNLKISIEYNEPLFINGYAVLTKIGSDQLEGIVDSIGNLKSTLPYYIDTNFPYVSDGMLAVKESPEGDWGFMNVENGELITVIFKGYKLNKKNLIKTIGINGKGVKGSFVFDFVAPFSEGIAVVHTEKTGWHHIDRYGTERFINPNMQPTLFRTSLHDGEAIIFDDRGIVLCKELPDNNSGIIKVISENFEIKNYANDLSFPYIINTDNSHLIINSKFQADKYENIETGDSIIFIERPPIIIPEIIEPTDSFTLDRDIKVSLSKNSVSAGVKGTATVTVNVSNIGEFDSKNLSVTVNINGIKKSWEGTIGIGTTQQITMYIPAKFSSPSISRDVEWVIKSDHNEIIGNDKVSIRRYKPSRR